MGSLNLKFDLNFIYWMGARPSAVTRPQVIHNFPSKMFTVCSMKSYIIVYKKYSVVPFTRISTLRPLQNGSHSAEHFKMYVFEKYSVTLLQITPKIFVSKYTTGSNSALFPATNWCGTGTKQ